MPTRVFLNVEQLVIAALEELVGAGRAGIETPANLEAVLPFVRVQRLGGGRDRLNDSCSLSVDVFAATYAEGEPLAEQVCAHLVGPPTPIDLLDRIDCEQAPIELPWGDSADARRWGMTFRAVSRPRRFL